MRTQAASLVAAFLFACLTVAQAGTITITPVPVGGTVTSNVGGLDCGTGGNVCTSTSIIPGTLVTATAMPDPGYEFVQWTIPGFGSFTNNPLTNPMPPSSFSASATFQATGPIVSSLLPASKTIAVGAGRTLTVTLAAPAVDDTFVTLDAQPVGIVSVPPGVLVLNGQTTALVPVTGVLAGTATVTATLLSTASSTIDVIPVAVVPSAPTMGLASAAGSGQAIVNFLPSDFDGGSDITLYTATSSPGGISASGPGAPITVSGLTNGTTYTFTVTATNGVGEGPPSAPSPPVTPNASAPTAPLLCSAVLTGNLMITVSCVPGSDGNSPILSYTATSSPGGLTASSADPATLVVSGLTRGIAYTFTVVATNAIGPSPASDPTLPVTAYAIPGAPTAVTATPGIGHATVSWTAPADDGGTPIVSYALYASPGGKLTNAASSGGTVSIPVGVPTTFTVSATNAAGEGPQSAPSNAVTATANVPNAPTRIHAMAGDGRATVSFLASTSDGGSPITSYIVTSSPGGITASGSGSPINVTGLANGSPYTFTVAAHNVAGTGLSAAPSNVVTPNVVGPRTSARAYIPNCGDDLVAVIDTGTNKVIDTVAVGLCPKAVAANSSGTRVYVANYGDNTLSVIDASNHTVVATVPVGVAPSGVAVNAAGTRVFVTSVGDGTVKVIDAVTNGVVTTIAGAMGTFSAGVAVHPSGNLAYVATDSESTGAVMRLDGLTGAYFDTIPLAFGPFGLAFSPGGGSVFVGSATSTSVATLIGTSVAGTVSGLPDSPYGIAVNPASGRIYATMPTAKVVAVIDAGAVVDAIATGTTPRGVAVTPTSNRVYVVNEDDGTVTAINAVNDGVIATIPVGVDPYAFGLFIGPDPILVPGAPTSVVATPGNAQASVAFLPPGSDGGGPITSYTATSSPSGITASSATSPIIVPSLTNGVAYTFTVTATNAAGTGPASAPSNIVTPRAVPGTPTGVIATPGNAQVTVSFSAPSDGGSPITLYTATCIPGPFQASNSVSPVIVPGLANGTAYACTVTATNAAGTGLPSAAANATPNIFVLSVTKSGTGSGSVTSSPAGIDCGATCGASFITGTPVTLTATPSTGLVFTGWSGACTGTGACQVTMSAAKSVTATFDLAVSTTALASSASSAILGSAVTLTATVTGGSGTAGGNVIFREAATNIGTVALNGSGQAALVTSSLALGSHSITASYQGGGVYSASSSAPVSVTIAPPARLGNISTRMQVLTGNDVMIGGFVIGGGIPKTVAIVATGPSLTQYGITNALANPTLTLVRQSDQAVLATNDNWQNDPNFVTLQSAGFAPSNTLEAAILITLQPGAYTAIVSGAGNGTGVGVVGVYEVDHPEVPLVNISTRGKVLTGNDVMIGGFIIFGSTPQTVAIVATGPSLVAYGINNALANPTLTLVRSSDQAVLATNDDWQTAANAAQLSAAGFAPSNSLESAILITLNPGAYTAVLSGVGGGTGVGIIGVYTVP